MQLLEHHFAPIQMLFVKDCQQFLLNTCDIHSNAKFLTHALHYHKIFQKSFSKKLISPFSEPIITKSLASIEHSVYFLCAKFCSNNILDIVLDFPDSHSVIITLKKCLDESHLLNELAEQLYLGIKKRLLIPGILTQDILNQYLNMLKVLQILDPNGIVFDKITTPIKNYLLKRNDTLRCIISHMTENGEISSGLTREMVRIPSNEYIDEASSD
jgi:anaphase-promoting complex subunit 2